MEATGSGCGTSLAGIGVGGADLFGNPDFFAYPNTKPERWLRARDCWLRARDAFGTLVRPSASAAVPFGTTGGGPAGGGPAFAASGGGIGHTGSACWLGA